MAKFVRALVLLQLFAYGHSSQWPVMQRNLQETFPNVELSLAPPLHPWPQVTAELNKLEENRERMENSYMDKLQSRYNAAVTRSRRRIGNLIAQMLHAFDDPDLLKSVLHSKKLSPPTFRQLPQESMRSDALSVKVNVLPASPPDPSLRHHIDDIEYQKSAHERRMFESAFGDLTALSNFVLNELEVQIQNHVSAIRGASDVNQHLRATNFLGERFTQLPSQSIFRVVPSDVQYPTLISMVQDMEARRDISENLEVKLIIEKEIDFLMLCNTAIAEYLHTAVNRILSQYNIIIRAAKQ